MKNFLLALVIISLIAAIPPVDAEESKNSNLCGSERPIAEIFSESNLIGVGTVIKEKIQKEFKPQVEGFTNYAKCKIDRILKGNCQNKNIYFSYILRDLLSQLSNE